MLILYEVFTYSRLVKWTVRCMWAVVRGHIVIRSQSYRYVHYSVWPSRVCMHMTCARPCVLLEYIPSPTSAGFDMKLLNWHNRKLYMLHRSLRVAVSSSLGGSFFSSFFVFDRTTVTESAAKNINYSYTI